MLWRRLMHGTTCVLQVLASACAAECCGELEAAGCGGADAVKSNPDVRNVCVASVRHAVEVLVVFQDDKRLLKRTKRRNAKRWRRRRSGGGGTQVGDPNERRRKRRGKTTAERNGREPRGTMGGEGGNRESHEGGGGNGRDKKTDAPTHPRTYAPTHPRTLASCGTGIADNGERARPGNQPPKEQARAGRVEGNGDALRRLEAGRFGGRPPL